jgi:hypothetical protein
MGTVHKLLERLGLVRLRDFGLLLTPDRRVLTTRQVLDDGFGGRVVGYSDGDLAAMELPAWGAAKPAAPVPTAPMLAPRSRRVSAPPPLPAAAAPRATPDPDEPDEPDWESEIAAARTRAEAEAEATIVSPPADVEDWDAVITAARARAYAEPPPIAAPRLVAPPVAEPPAELDWDVAIAQARAAAADVAVRTVEGARPPTIIPVPILPRSDPRLVQRYQPSRAPRSSTPRIR